MGLGWTEGKEIPAPHGKPAAKRSPSSKKPCECDSLLLYERLEGERGSYLDPLEIKKKW